MSEAFVVGAELVLSDKATPEMRRLIESAAKLDESLLAIQAKFDTLGLGRAVSKIKAEWQEIDRITQGGVESVLKTAAGMNAELGKSFTGVVAGASSAFEEVAKAAGVTKDEVLDIMRATATGSAEAMRAGIAAAAPGIFDPLVGAAEASARRVETIMAGVGRTMSAGSAGRSVVSALEENASLGTRKAAAHGVHAAHASGLHFGRMGAHVGGAHTSMGGDGIVPAVAGYGTLELLKHATEGAMEFRHWEEMFKSSSFSGIEIGKAEKAAWDNAMGNPNVSATDSLKSIFEMIKVFPKAGEQGPSVEEAVSMLPAFSNVMVGLQSVKAEGLHSKFAEGRQIYDLAKGLEETGVTQRGATAEIREANTKHMLNESFKTMLSERGVTDGSQFYQMTNNAKGSAQNWDERMATVVAPILGSVMRHSKLGNADYMALKSYQGGHITSDAVQALMKYKMVDDDDVWEDSKKAWHLKANSHFAEGMQSNVWDWSGRTLERMKSNGIDVSNQDQVNKVINEIGSNGSTTNLMRALLEPATRSQIAKDMYARDQVKDSALGQLQANDPILKLDAVQKSFSNFFAAFGAGLVDPAIKGLTALTSGVNALSAAMEAHPEITKYAAGAAGVGGLGLLGYGAGKMLGVFGGGDAGLGIAATKLDAAADHLMLVGGGGGAPGAPGGGPGKSPGYANLTPAGILATLGLGYLVNGLPDAVKRAGTDGSVLDPSAQREMRAGDAMRHFFGIGSSAVTHPDDDRSTRARASEVEVLRQQQDMIKSVGQQFGSLNTNTGFVLTSFDGLKTKSGGLNGTFGILEATAIGAARALAQVAMSGGGMGGGSGFMNASYGDGGGGGGGSPDLSAAFRGGAGAGIGHLFSAADREGNIRKYAASIGINPDVAMAVARSEGFGKFSGDRNTSFGDLQMHIGGGLGDFYRRATGKNPADPHNELELDRFALDQAKKGGWAPWHGAAAKHIYGRYGIGNAPIAGAPPQSKTITPGRPAGKQNATTAQLQPIHNHFYVDGKHIATNVVSHIVAGWEHPNSVGGPDTYGTHHGPETALNDAA